MVKMNKLKTFLLVCVFTLAIPFYAFAEETDSVVVTYGAGEWEYLGQENVTFAYIKETLTDTYTATDGGNFKIDITTSLYPSNTVSAVAYVNGDYWASDITGINNHKGTLEFSGLPKGAEIWFYIDVASNDTMNFKFYD